MANVKLGQTVIPNVSSVQLENADNPAEPVVFAAGGGGGAPFGPELVCCPTYAPTDEQLNAFFDAIAENKLVALTSSGDAGILTGFHYACGSTVLDAGKYIVMYLGKETPKYNVAAQEQLLTSYFNIPQ